ncbi:MAG TPA: phosphatidylglycerophosphatase A [Anaeromyxobacteraceae bacterium]|nr:phosphatidylglycerophosphatase A [Anaeromyxobacteraceae bacterium]
MTTVVHPSSDRQEPGPRRFIPRRLRRGMPEGPPTPWVIVAAWGPCGFSPWAPGTVGTAGAIPLFWLMRDLPLWVYLLTVVGLTAVAVYSAGVASRYWKVPDASPIVIDEVAGYLVTMAVVPWSWPAAILGFFLFRFFDIAKPWPASWFDRQKNPFGVVMDDVAAGVWAAFAFHFVALALRLVAGCASGDVSFWCAELTP